VERTIREIAIAVPSLDQGRYLPAALDSLFSQTGVVTHVAVVDGGSTDETAGVIARFRSRLAWSRMAPDAGQTAAINEGLDQLLRLFPRVDYVGWLNADDVIWQGGLRLLAATLDEHPGWVAVAGRAQLISESGEVLTEIATRAFEPGTFDHMCTISQPATLVRRAAWQQVGGLDARLHMCFDYDLWWRLARIGAIGYVREAVVAGSRDHASTKTRTRRPEYFREAMEVVRRHTGHVPWHWCISEALEREAGWRFEVRPGLASRVHAGVRAIGSYLRWNLMPRAVP
jgi:GT2 family glycosyltransferase